jgi:hypothetical protein
MNKKFNFIIFKPYEGIHFAIATLHKDIPLDLIDSYTGQIFQFMINCGMVKDTDEMLISLNILIENENAHIVAIRRFNPNFGFNRKNIIEKIYNVLENDDGQKQTLFVVNYDPQKPIVYCGYQSVVSAKEFKELKLRVMDVFDTFPKLQINYMMTIKKN